MANFDFVVVGSGFGGAVAACRLAEAGQRVLVLERGRQWDETNYPSVTNRNWIFDVDEPERQNGWLDLRWFDDMAVAQGAGVGGGSLIYANVSVPPPPTTFESGWPEAITAAELAPYVARVGEMLEVATLPENQRTRRWDIVRRGAEALGHGNRFSSLPLAVRFDKNYNPRQLADPHNDRHAIPQENLVGRQQRTCIHLGDCDIGCRVKAKNTLDLNYLARATQKGAEIRPLHVVRRITPDRRRWQVHYDRITDGKRSQGAVVADHVVLSAGSLGSTEILLRSQLAGVSQRIGYGWSPNGDFLTPAVSDETVEPTVGPTVTACIDHTDGVVYGQKIFLQDGGFPNLLRSSVSSWDRKLPKRWREHVRPFADWALNRDPLRNVMPWFAQGIDASDGRLYLRRRYLGLFGPRRLTLDWKVDHSKPTIDAIVTAHEALARATNAKPIVSPTWTLLRDLITPHPLGGCSMADDASRGVVDHAGRVFNARGLYVADGAIVPRAIGRNPSRTIAALAERAVEHWP